MIAHMGLSGDYAEIRSCVVPQKGTTIFCEGTVTTTYFNETYASSLFDLTADEIIATKKKRAWWCAFTTRRLCRERVITQNAHMRPARKAAKHSAVERIRRKRRRYLQDLRNQ